MPPVFITCAVTGAGDTVAKSEHVPVSPEEIAADCIAAAEAGAAVVHIHVRDPATGAAARDVQLYEDVVRRIRRSDTDVVINLTAGMGGDLTLGSVEQPLPPSEIGTDMAGAGERVAHVAAIRPEIATLDCGSMNFGHGDYIMTNTPAMLQAMAEDLRDLGVRPEIEVFDTGHLWQAKALVAAGVIDEPVMVQLCMGIAWGAPNDLNTYLAMRNNVPDGWVFSAFSTGADQLRYVALAAISGGNVRVGLEDNLYLERGVLATNADLVERAVHILTGMNYSVAGPDEVRSRLKLRMP